MLSAEWTGNRNTPRLAIARSGWHRAQEMPPKAPAAEVASSSVSRAGWSGPITVPPTMSVHDVALTLRTDLRLPVPMGASWSHRDQPRLRFEPISINRAKIMTNAKLSPWPRHDSSTQGS